MPRSRLHRPTVVGRVRSDPGLLVLMGLVVALTTVLTAAVGPLTERTADRAIADTVRDAGTRGTVVATLPKGYDDPQGKRRDPHAAVRLRQDTEYAQSMLPPGIRSVLRPGVATLTSTPLHLLDAGPGRYLRLAFVAPPDGAPEVTYTAGRSPRASVGAGDADVTIQDDEGPWPVQVALSEAAALALRLRPGDRVPAETEQHQSVNLRISGVYAAADPDDDAWQVVTELLNPTQGVSEGIERTSAAALVSIDALPDLELAVPAEALTQRTIFVPRPERLRWSRSAAIQREVGSLESSGGLGQRKTSWSSLLGGVLGEGRAQVASARGQAQVLVVGLVVAALLVLVQAGQLLVRRRAAPVTMARERGASVLGIAVELLVESLAVAALGTAVGLGLTLLLVGDAGWAWTPVLVGAALASPVLGALLAVEVTGRRVPANRTARRTAARVRVVRRVALEAVVLGAAALSLVALRQRGTGDLTAAGAATWWAVAGTVVVLRLLPPALRLALRATRRSAGSVPFLVTARLAQTGVSALPLLVVSLTVAQLTFAVALAATEQEGQSAGALLAVGGDARLTTTAGPDVAGTADRIADRPGVRAAASGRVADAVRVSSESSAGSVRLVVVDAPAYEQLLVRSDLPDAPALDRLTSGDGERVPALLLGGAAGLRDGLVVTWDDTNIPLSVVGTAPRVDASVDPVVVVDAEAFAAAGAIAPPDTVWAVGPGAASALTHAAGSSGSVVRYADTLDARRDAPLPEGLVRLAVAASALLLLLAVLGVVLSALTEAPARSASLGRLRALGLRDGDLRRVLAGELLVPVAVAALAGLALGVSAARVVVGSLDLERITGQTGTPSLVVPWWTALVVVALLVAALAVAAVEWRRLRRRVLAQLLRS
ncbi:FtsX-like permease family protein [Nocardioides sp. 503]|uniref:FtsX-like permease family protein n=1 Tax=Nocardioides sp. 503 TaxID=2508326 RepID=UPI00106FB0FE|nr:FtsX-like permease family protein [Nocardioides sp. 503]